MMMNNWIDELLPTPEAEEATHDLFTEHWLTDLASMEPRTVPAKHRRTTNYKLITQNVRGFKKTSRARWLGSWRYANKPDVPDIILIQETHITTQQDKDDLEREWCRLWGVQGTKTAFTHWSMGAEPTGGVGILVNPTTTTKIDPIDVDRWTTRLQFVQVGDLTIGNVYAPTDRGKREFFFRTLRAQAPLGANRLILGGDFNCVLDTRRDRITDGRPGTGGAESPELQRTINSLGLIDTMEALETMNPDASLEPLTTFTYWRGRSASRIDRFYVSTKHSPETQWVRARMPAVSSDHQELQLTWGSEARHQRQKGRSVDRCKYPIRTDRPDLLEQDISERLNALGEPTSPAAWDGLAESTARILRQARAEDTSRRRVRARDLLRRRNASTRTREQILRVEANHDDWQRSVRRGRRLADTKEQLKALYKRTSNWTRDQRVSTLHPSNGRAYPDRQSLADSMAAEWSSIFGQSHRTCPDHALRTRLRSFVKIPTGKKVSQAENDSLLKEITAEDMTKALRGLNRNKGAGPDGLNNDFYKDYGDIMAEKLLPVLNAMLQGAQPPASFLEALVIPLRKNGDSPRAMDYRPIMLLQTSYKLLAGILAGRLQGFLARLIGDHQQGFVRGRQIRRSLALMLAQLQTSFDDQGRNIEDTPGILLLDFFKAYDTVDRGYLLAVLKEYGFDESFVDLIARTHLGTTAIFLVNGEQSEPGEVVSGIRQGCPLAPLLFLLAVEPLALALQANFIKTTRRATEAPQVAATRRTAEATGSLSAFVDDTVVFLPRGRDLPKVMRCVEDFGALSGLKAQPTKSCYIPLNVAVNQRAFHAIPCLPHGSVTRYLGVNIGTGPLHDANWPTTIQALKVRLAVAAQLHLSVLERVQLLNTVMLPAVLYKAAYIPPDPTTITKLTNLQKNFLWTGLLSTSSTRHKLAPALVYLPRGAGGLGMFDIKIAVQTQAIQHAVEWLEEEESPYTIAWKTLRTDSERRSIRRLTPASPVRRWRPEQSGAEYGWDLLQTDLGAQDPRPADWVERYCNQWHTLRAGLDYWVTPNDSLHVVLETEPQEQWEWSRIWTDYWPTFDWGDNAWVLGGDARPLAAKNHATFFNCSIDRLRITRHDHVHFSFNLPRMQGRRSRHKAMLDWALSLILSIPTLAKPQVFMVTNQATLLFSSPDAALQGLEWRIHSHEAITSLPQAGWTGRRTGNRYIWDMVAATGEPSREEADDRGPTACFAAHPKIHSVPWQHPSATGKCPTKQAIRKARAKRQQRNLRQNTGLFATKLEQTAQNSSWHAQLMDARPDEVWGSQGVLTQYNVWFYARMSMGQLNLHYEDRPPDRHCTYGQPCTGETETIEHILWHCTPAKRTWELLRERWTQTSGGTENASFRQRILTRQAPPLTRRLKEQVRAHYGTFTAEHGEAYELLWWILCSVLPALLWLRRNERVFRGHHEPTQRPEISLWNKAMAICTTTANTQRATGSTRLQGICMLQLLPILKSETRPRADPGPTHAVTRLRLHFDGGARGNPGPGGSGWCVSQYSDRDRQWRLVGAGFRYTGPHATNNESEIQGLRTGLTYIKRAFTRSTHTLEVRGDSQLLINAFRGRNCIRAATLTQHIRAIKALIGVYASVEWTHIKRKHNKAADFLANVAMDAKATGVVAPPTLEGDNQRKARVQQLIEQDHQAQQEQGDQPILITRMRTYARSDT